MILVKRCQSYEAAKLAVKKKSETFWVRGYVFRSVTIVNLVFGRSGFDSRTAQSLRTCIFAGHWPALTYDSFLETFKTFLLGNPKINRFAAFLI